MAIVIAPFYNVQYAVGKGLSNFSTDVMLVQYFLFHICVNPVPHWTGNRGNWTPVLLLSGPGAIFPFNGVYTPELSDWIAVFQRAANERGLGPLTVDGRVNRAPVGWGKKSSGKATWYTLQAMNFLMWRFNDKAFASLGNVSDIPGALAKDLNGIQFSDYSGPGG